MVVVDASVALEILIRSPAGIALGDRLFDGRARPQAPHLADIEIAHVLRRYAAGGEATPAVCAAALSLWLALPGARHPHGGPPAGSRGEARMRGVCRCGPKTCWAARPSPRAPLPASRMRYAECRGGWHCPHHMSRAVNVRVDPAAVRGASIMVDGGWTAR